MCHSTPRIRLVCGKSFERICLAKRPDVNKPGAIFFRSLSEYTVTKHNPPASNNSGISSASDFVLHPRNQHAPQGLERLPTTSLLQNLGLGSVFCFPLLLKPSLKILRNVANSKFALLSADKNPVLQFLLRPILYDQFCAGTNASEISRTRESIEGLGYSGVVLCYGKEIQITKSHTLMPTGEDVSQESEIEHWKKGTLDTLDMLGTGNWLGIKFTGAGSAVTNALMQDKDPPDAFQKAMHIICEKAATQDTRIWIDAEQQVLQKSIDRWTIDLMRQYNSQGSVVVYNTLQAYLKASRDKLRQQLALSHKEGWYLAIKLVRGAYIDNDQRELIHDTKQATDDSYNSIVRDLLSGTNLGFPETDFPSDVRLILAGHNPESVAAAWHLIQNLHKQKRLKILPDFAQLQGMGEVLGCKFLAACEGARIADPRAVTPRIYKCLTWGSVGECMQYLFRRVVENSGGTDRMTDGVIACRKEIWRRILQRRPRDV